MAASSDGGRDGTRSLIFVGVGGQGIILSTNITSQVLLEAGYDVKTSEVHGMAQRGGSVLCMVRYGERVLSPLVPVGEADWMVAAELLEGLRYLEYMSSGGWLILNRYRLDPLPVLRGDEEYPTRAEDLIKDSVSRLIVVDALESAREAGDIRAANIVLLGILSRGLDVSEEIWVEKIAEMVPDRAREANLRAFRNGRSAPGVDAL